MRLGKDDIVFRIDASLEPLKNKLAQAKRELFSEYFTLFVNDENVPDDFLELMKLL